MASPFDLLANGITQYVVAPINAFGFGGFVFDVEGETSVNLNSEITDHYLEDNSPVQDHIAIRPKRIVLKRFVGELVYKQDDSLTTNIQNVVQKLTAISSFLPTLSKAATQIYNLKSKDLSFASLKSAFTSTTVNQLTDYYAFAKNLFAQDSAQVRAYTYLKALQEARILVSVQTPFEFLNNMAIESVVAVQSENSKYIGDFSITMKQIRFATLLSAPSGTAKTVTSGAASRGDLQNYVPATDQVAPPTMQPIAATQVSPVQNNGVVAGTAQPFPTSDQQWKDLGLLPPPRSR